MVVATKQHVSAKWRKLFKLIPGYDPMAQAGDCYFDETAAEHVLEFSATCIEHVKSTTTVPAGTPFILEPWQQAFVGCLFGWKRPDGRRRYRECFLYVPKKNGKSALAAMLTIYVLTQDHELAAELFSAAASQEQTRCIFDHVKLMIQAEPALKDMLTVYGDKGGTIRKSVYYAAENSSYICLTSDADTVDGPSVHWAAIDEVHRHKKPELAQVLKKSSRARRQPIIFYTTTADYNRDSLCNTLLKKAHTVQQNDGDPEKPGYFPDFLPVIYEATTEDDYLDPEVHARANPNLGVTIEADDMASDAREAAEIPSELNSFLRLRLNIVTDADVAWITKAMWEPCAGGVDAEALRGKPCWGGLDLASTSDMTAFVLLFPDDDGHIKLLPYFWVPEKLIRPQSHKNWNLYDTWARAGYLQTTPGDVIDYTYVRKEIVRLGGEHVIKAIGVDYDWQGAQLSQELQDQEGFTVVPYRMGFRTFGMPTKMFETHIKARTVEHGAHPILAWQAYNVVVQLDGLGNIRPDKKKSEEKIDGIVSAITALGVWIEGNEATEEPGISIVW